MKPCLAFVIILGSSFVVASQTAVNVDTDIEQIRSVAAALTAKRAKVEVMFRDLTRMTGYVTGHSADSFVLSSRKKVRWGYSVSYRDVLAIFSKAGSVSLIPDPKATPYGDWADLKKILPNTLIEVTQKNGEVKAGRFRSSGADTLLVAGKENNVEWTLQRSDIAYVHHVRYGVRDISGALASGTNKGAKIGKGVAKTVGQIIGPISGQPLGSGNGTGTGGHAMGAGVGAVVGLIIGAASKTDSVKVLMFSQ